jgi:hypothetical protein
LDFHAAKRARYNRTTVLPEFYEPILSPAEEEKLIHGMGTPYFDYLEEQRINDLPSDQKAYPFYDHSEWQLAKFLMTSGLSMQRIDEFLKLPWVIHISIFTAEC